MDSEDSESEEFSYITTRRGVIQTLRNPFKHAKKPDRINGEYSYNSKIKQRILGQPCIDCKLECDLRIAERFRLDNYLHFWGKLKNWEERRVHARRLIQVYRVPQIKAQTRKKFLRKYYLEIQDGVTLVCKTMFFNTLAISAKFLETTLKVYPDNLVKESDLKLVHNPAIIPKSMDTSYTERSKKDENMKIKEVPLTHCHNTNSVDQNLSDTSSEATVEKQLFENQFLDGKEDIKAMKSPCSCPEQCGKKVSEETRIKIHSHFWKFQSWEERKLFIINTIEKDRYTSIRTYLLPMKNGEHITVCQEMYLNTLALDNKVIQFTMPETINDDTFAEESNENFTAYNLKDNKYQLQEADNENVSILDYNNQTELDMSKDYTKDNYAMPVKRIKFEMSPLKPPCSCKLQCKLKLTEEIRQQIHKEFWNLPAQVDQRHFILSTIQTQVFRNKITKIKKKVVKNYFLPFHYENIIVCREMYLQTLAISQEFVENALKNINTDGSIVEDDDLQNVNEPRISGYGSHEVNKNECHQSTLKKVANKLEGMKKSDKIKKSECDEREFINCAELLESKISEDILLKEKSIMKKTRRSRKSKKLKPPCPSSCRYRCSEKFNEEQRIHLHDKFWCSSWLERKQFVMNTVEEFPIVKRTIPGRLTRRNFSRKYTLPDKENRITVCQKMYFNTLSVCSKFVSAVHIWASQVKW